MRARFRTSGEGRSLSVPEVAAPPAPSERRQPHPHPALGHLADVLGDGLLVAAALVALVAATHTGTHALAAPKQTLAPAEVRAKVDRAGIGERAKVTVWLRDGRKIKGYVAERRDDEFVLRDRKTDAPAIVPYGDVTRLDINRGHSTARNTAIGVAIGAGAVLTTLAILIASLDD